MTIWYDWEHEAVVVKMALPLEVDEAVTPNEDGTHTVIINDRITEEKARRAYAHALRHIEAGDFQSGEDAQTIERRAHDESA